MKWWKGLLGLERDGGPGEGKNVIGLDAWASRHDGTNFRTNQVTLAQYEDSRAVGLGNALGLSATWACVNLIAGTIASLPLMVYRTSASGVRTVARDHPLYGVLHDSPNFDQTAVDFWEFMAAGIELQGNAYAEVTRGTGGRITALTPIRPDAVTVRRKPSGFLEYEWTLEGRRSTRDVLDVLHIRGPMGNALGGVSTLTACARAFGSALSADTAARRVFANGLHPSGVLSTDKEVSLTKEQRSEFNEYIGEHFVGALNAGRPLLLDRGMSWTQLNITPEDAQMLESRKFGGEEICRIFGVPPAMVGFGDKASNWGTGKEVDVLGFQKFTLRRRLKRIEQALGKQLLSTADRAAGVIVEFNLEGLLRGDSLLRAQVNDIRLKNKSITINEVRAQDNQPPVPWGDRPWGQMQDLQLSEDGTIPAPGAGQENG